LPGLCRIIGVPVQDGAGRLGCDMGPSAYRAAGIAQALSDLGHEVIDYGNIVPRSPTPVTHANHAIKALPRIAAWIEAIADVAYECSADAFPVFMGGDHSLSAGTLAGLARRAGEMERAFFVLWLDAHTDFHTLTSTRTGNLHGVPIAYATGQPGFEGYLPLLHVPVAASNICMMGIRSVDPEERLALRQVGITVHDMRSIDENGVAHLLSDFLNRVAAANGLLHVSLDVDFLDPGIAPGVGTTVPGGATFREAHLIMEILHDRGLVSSIDLAELNPFLDERGKTALLMVDLLASLMGRQVLDRPTQSFS
jgi:arginase